MSITVRQATFFLNAAIIKDGVQRPPILIEILDAKLTPAVRFRLERMRLTIAQAIKPFMEQLQELSATNETKTKEIRESDTTDDDKAAQLAELEKAHKATVEEIENTTLDCKIKLLLASQLESLPAETWDMLNNPITFSWLEPWIEDDQPQATK